MAALRVSGNRDPEFSAYYLLWQRIPHYYGDIVRQLFLGLVVLMMVGAPFFSTDLAVEFPFIILGSIIIAGLAALTNPLKKWVMYLNVIAAGAGLILYEMAALVAYSGGEQIGFALRQAIAIIFLFAFYFGMKTLRAMLMGKIGEVPSKDDFELQRKDERWRELASEQEDVTILKEENEEVVLDGLGRPAAPDTDKLD